MGGQTSPFVFAEKANRARFQVPTVEAKGIVLRREVAVSAEIHSHPADK